MDSPQNSLNLKGMNQWALISFALVGFVVGYGVNEIISSAPSSEPRGGSQQAANPTPTPAAPRQIAVPVANAADADDDAFLGKKNAPVTMIEFTDYQCPFCKRHSDNTFDQIKKEYIDTGKLKYVVRDLPLAFHNNAQKAAEATECAEDQGKFWEMHDKLFEDQQQLDIASLKKYAKDLGLNTSTFDGCLDSGKYEDEVKKDMKDAQASGISGTPGFLLINKKGEASKISGAQPFSSFKTEIDKALE